MAVDALNALPTYSAASNATGVVTETFADPSPTMASLSYLPATYAVTSGPVPEVSPSGGGAGTTTGGAGTTQVATATTTSAAEASPTPSSTGTCQAGTLDEADCDSLCAGGTCTTGSTALGQQVTTCSDCP